MTFPARTFALVAENAPFTGAPRHQTNVAGRLEDFPVEARVLLSQLRLAALSCRSAARLDVFEACALLSLERAVAAPAAAAALVRALPEALGGPPVFFRPGVASVSFDEAWLLRAITARQDGDLDSLAFLLGSRLAPAMRRQVGFLLATLDGAAAAA